MSDQVAFENGQSVHTVDFPYDAIDKYCFGASPESADADTLLAAFVKAFDWVSNVSPGDFKGMAIRVQTIRCVLTGKDQTVMAREIGVTKAAISQRMSELRDFFNIKQPKAGLRSDETRQKFSIQCTQRHQKRKSSSSQASPITLTANSDPRTR